MVPGLQHHGTISSRAWEALPLWGSPPHSRPRPWPPLPHPFACCTGLGTGPTQGGREGRGPPSAWGSSRLAWPPRRTGQEACPSHSSPSHTCLHSRAVSVIHKRASSWDLHLLPGSLFSPRGQGRRGGCGKADPGLRELQPLALPCLLPAGSCDLLLGLQHPPPPNWGPHRCPAGCKSQGTCLPWAPRATTRGQGHCPGTPTLSCGCPGQSCALRLCAPHCPHTRPHPGSSRPGRTKMDPEGPPTMP